MCWTLERDRQGEEAGYLEAHLSEMTRLFETLPFCDSLGVEKPQAFSMVSTLGLDCNSELFCFASPHPSPSLTGVESRDPLHG